MAKIVRMRWELFPNETLRELHTDVRLACRYYGHCDNGAPSFLSDVEKLSDDHRQLLDSLYAIHGVKQVGLHAYEIRITKGEVFEWEEIAPKVAAAFADWVGATDVEMGDVIDRFPKKGTPEYAAQFDRY